MVIKNRLLLHFAIHQQKVFKKLQTCSVCYQTHKVILTETISLFLMNLPTCYNKELHRIYICEEKSCIIIWHENYLSVMTAMTLLLSSLEIVDTWYIDIPYIDTCTICVILFFCIISKILNFVNSLLANIAAI